jgi:hypothetical protein
MTLRPGTVESLTLNSRKPILRSSKKCQDVWEQLDPSEECLIKLESEKDEFLTLELEELDKKRHNQLTLLQKEYKYNYQT